MPEDSTDPGKAESGDLASNATYKRALNETKRLKSIITRAIVALKDTDIHLMTIDVRAIGRENRDPLDLAIGNVRTALQILVERGRGPDG